MNEQQAGAPPMAAGLAARTVAAPDAAERARRRRSRDSALVLAVQVALVILVIAGAYWLSRVAGRLIMPSPTDILTQFVKLWRDGTRLNALGQSLVEMLSGFALGAVTGVVGGMLLGGFRFVGRVLDPFVNAINSTPGAAFIPLIIAWFGLYTEAKVVVVWHAAFFPILIATAAGIGNANKELVEMARSFGASRLTLFWRVMLPDAVPTILSGLRIGAAIATVGTVVAELYMAQSGLGGLLADAGARFQMDRYFAVVIVLMALGTLITGGLKLVENRLGRWRISQREGR
jgi:NitT/TauT family transport system permease protein